MKDELISILIPCYNGEKYLNRCFDAILKQTHKKIEVIIVNDGSKDNTKNIIEKYKKIFDENGMSLRYFEQINQGQAAAMNTAFKFINGQYMVWQDCDDYYEEDALESMLNYLNENPNINFVRACSYYRDEKDLHIISRGESKYPNSKKIFDSYVFEFDSYAYCGVFMTKVDYFDSCINNRTIYNSRAGQNWQIILPLAYYGECGYLNKVVYNYIVRDTSHSHQVKGTKELLKRCNQHQDILLNVLRSINMSKKEHFLYDIKIRIKYLIRKKRIIFKKRDLKKIYKKIFKK